MWSVNYGVHVRIPSRILAMAMVSSSFYESSHAIAADASDWSADVCNVDR